MKIRSLKMKSYHSNHNNDNDYFYDKMEKSESMRVEIQCRKARKLIEDTLKIADSPKMKSFAF